VHEPKPSVDTDTPLSFSMEGYHGLTREPSAAIPFFWAPAWNSNESLNKFQDEVAGPLRGGNPGVRLIEPQAIAKPDYFDAAPGAFKPRASASPGELLIIPVHHIFGSEELSVEAKALAERVPAPYLALNPDDAARLDLSEGDPVRVLIDGKMQHLPVRLHAALVPGLAGIPWGLRGLVYLDLPAWRRIDRTAST
jgi:NADH-quinone oxidoreductase subunit G